MHAADITAEKNRQIALQQAAGMDADRVQSYWGRDVPQSSIVSNFAASNVGQATQVNGSAPMNAFDYIAAGFNHSVSGLIISHGQETRGDQGAVLGGTGLVPRLLYSGGQMVGDLPWAFGGAVGGSAAGGGPEDGAGIITGGFGAAALPEASRQTLLAAARAGEIHSAADAIRVIQNGAWDTLKAGAAGGLGGAVMGPVGGAVLRAAGSEVVAGGAATVANAGVATTASAVAEGRMPTAQDFALGAAAAIGMHGAMGGFRPTPAAAAHVESNMRGIWGSTGLSPAEQIARAKADPTFRQELLQQDVQGDPVAPNHQAFAHDEPEPAFQPPPKPPKPPHIDAADNPARSRALMNSAAGRAVTMATDPPAMPHFIPSVDHAMDLLRQLEGSGNTSVSPAGAIGHYQIMPGTARMYGFDATRLFDPAYNETVARVIVSDLFRRYHGNMDAIAIAYNAGQGRANQYLTQGEGTRLEAIEDRTVRGGIRYVQVHAAKNEAFLPLETQKYLANGRRRAGGPLSPEEGSGSTITPDNERPDGRAIPSWESGELPHSIEEMDAESRPAGSVSAASIWDDATLDDAHASVRESLAEPPRRSLGDALNPDRLLTHYFSELQPARGVDNRLVDAGLMNRKTDFGTEDALRQTYASDARAGVWVRFGQIDGPDTKNIVPESESLFDAVRAMRKAGGNPDDWRDYMLSQRTVQKSTEFFDRATARLAALEEQLAGDPDGKIAAKNRKAAARALEAAAKRQVDTPVEQRAGFDREQRAFDQAKAAEAENARQRAAHTAATAELERAKENPGIDTGINPFAAKRIANDPAEQAKYEEATRIWTRVNNSVLDYAVKAGRYSQEQVNAMKALNTTYISMRRLVGDDASFDTPYTKGFTIGSPLKKMEGSDRQIVDPQAATIDNMRLTVKSADQNWARGQLIGLAEKDPRVAAQLGLRRVDENMDPNDDKVDKALKGYGFTEDQLEQARTAYGPLVAAREEGSMGKNEFGYYRNGTLERWQIADPDFANLLRGSYSRGQVGLITKTAQVFAAGQRAGVVIMPDFPMRSALSHQIIQFINDPIHPTPFVTWMRGITHVIGNDHVYQDALAKGAMGGALVDMDRDYLAHDVNTLFNETGVSARVWNQVTHPLQLAQLVSERIDAANRVGYTLAAQGKGIEPLKAATQARKAGIDYAEKAASSVVNWWAGITPFFRPKLLYVKNFSEAWAERPWETLAYSVGAIAVPTALLWAANYVQDQAFHANGQDDRRYSEIPRWERDYAIITPEIAGQRFKLRFPEGNGAVFGAGVNRILDAMAAHDPKAMSDWAGLILQQLPVEGPAMVQAPLEALSNHSFGTGRPLIPASLTADSPELQYTPNTTPVSKAIARLLGPPMDAMGLPHPSPIALDHIVQGWSGTAGTRLMHILGAPFDRPGPPGDVADIPFVQGLVIRQPGLSAQSIQNFYEDKRLFDTAQADVTTTKRNVSGGNSDDVKRVTTELPYAGMDSHLNGVAHTLGLMRASLWGIYENPTMTVDEKRQHIESVYNQMIGLTQGELENMEAFKRAHPR